MGNPRGVKRDFDALEARRLRAASLVQAGKEPGGSGAGAGRASADGSSLG